jgi:hypothetical protein
MLIMSKTNKKILFLFAQPKDTIEHSDIVLITKKTSSIIDENSIIQAGGIFCDNHIHFKKGISREVLADLLTKLRDSYGSSLFIAYSRGSKLWEIEPSAGYFNDMMLIAS